MTSMDTTRQRGQHCDALLDKTNQRDYDKGKSQEREENLDKGEGGHHSNDCVMIIIQQELWHKALETFDKR